MSVETDCRKRNIKIGDRIGIVRKLKPSDPCDSDSDALMTTITTPFCGFHFVVRCLYETDSDTSENLDVYSFGVQASVTIVFHFVQKPFIF